MDIFKQLKKDHDEVKEMFEKLTQTRQPSSRKKIMDKINKELTSHIKLEEKHLYAHMQKHDELKDMALKGHEEHEIVKKLLREISRTDDSGKWMAKFHVMEELVQMHIKEEEKQIFKKASQVLGRSMSQELGEKYDREHEQMMAKAA
ncbi:MAG: hemerythrin domain-containing protein [Thermoleophilia bacterium]|nr:hemerythrin domain-containing protein [Thermoleophilia bacterium]